MSKPAVILFDGVCVLCSRLYRFVSTRDRAQAFRFVTIQSEEGRALAKQYGINPDDPATFAVIDQYGAHVRSDGALRVLGGLPRWHWSRLLRAVPRPVRDWVYNVVARNRYSWFGKLDQCMVPQDNIDLRRQ